MNQFIEVKTTNGTFLLNLSNVVAVRRDRDKGIVKMFMVDGNELEVKHSMKELKELFSQN